MEHGPPSEIDNYSVNEKNFPSMYGNRKFITALPSLPGRATNSYPEHSELSLRFH
jgi:hypothetical protein